MTHDVSPEPPSPPDQSSDSGTALEKVLAFVPGKASSISECAQKLYETEASRLELFLYGGVVVRLATGQRGVLQIVPLTKAAARSRFEKYVEFVRPDKDSGVQRTVLSEDMAAALLEADERQLIPRLNGIIQQPFLVPRGGDLIPLSPGYNPTEGLHVIRGAEIPDMPLDEAVRLLIDDLLGEFHFARPSDKARAVAAVLSLAFVVGQLIPGRPALMVIEADLSQSGKGFLARLVAALYGESPTYVTKRTGGVGSLDESLDNAFITGRPLVVIDNVRGSVNSQLVESFLTEPSHTARIPYKPPVEVDPTRFLLFLTSNGAELTKDLANRASFIRIRKRLNHQYRTFPEGDLLQHVSANQPRFLGAVFAVVRHWFRSGRPHTNETRHTFRPWVQTMDWIVQNVFSLPPIMNDHEAQRDRASLPGLGLIRQLAIALDQRGMLGQNLKAAQLFNFALDSNIEIPKMSDATMLDDNKGARFLGIVLGHAFGDRDELPIDDYVVRRGVADPNEVVHHPGKTYTFTKEG